jgi:hypothetical protein
VTVTVEADIANGLPTFSAASSPAFSIAAIRYWSEGL